MIQALKHLGVFLLWNLLASAAILLLAPPLGAAVALPLSAWLLWGYVLRRGQHSAVRRRATLRLRPLAPSSYRWVALSVPVLLTLSWSLGEVYLRLVPVPPETLNPFGHITETALGRLSIALLAVAVAPLLEEFFFRGLIQRTLERRWGVAAGIIGAAALFAVVHVLPWVFPLHFVLGVAFGYAVYATRSIWTGVILHAANNSVALFGLRSAPTTPQPTLWEAGVTPDWWVALSVLLLASGAAAWTARGLWISSRTAVADPGPAVGGGPPPEAQPRAHL